MKISISAIGRLRNSPEKELIDDYLSRFSKLSKPFGLSLNSIVEIKTSIKKNLDDLVKLFPFQRIRFSKYCFAVDNLRK